MARKFIKAPGAQFAAHSADINEMLGLGRKGKLPKQGMPMREIQGVNVWVEPLVPRPHKVRNFQLRVMCQCPECGFVTAVGRLHQHSKVHA